MEDRTIYVKALCDYNACALKGTDSCQHCKDKAVDKLEEEGYAVYEGKVLLLGPDLNE